MSIQEHTRASERRDKALNLYLMDADVALVAEDHLVAILSLWRAADVAHYIFVVLNAQALLRLDGLLHLLLAHTLQLDQNTLHRQLVQLWQCWRREDKK